MDWVVGYKDKEGNDVEGIGKQWKDCRENHDALIKAVEATQ